MPMRKIKNTVSHNCVCYYFHIVSIYCDTLFGSKLCITKQSLRCMKPAFIEHFDSLAMPL
jgi:hypothetical protein